MRKILIANRGEIARRIIVTAHRMGLETVAVYSDADARGMHVREATTAYALGGNTSTESYLRADKLIDAARITGVDAVHPGYGFLSEDADFARTVLDAGLTWIGPPAAAIRVLGDKGNVKALAAKRGVPCLPGYAGEDQSDQRLAVEAEKIGFPLMVKAVAGGGGRGMRLVTEADKLFAAVEGARSEAKAGFGNGNLLIERAVMNPRHIEIQVFADRQGNAVHMGERDCSVQRRYQKIIEESPSPAVSPELRKRMGECAVTLTKSAGYVGAGTVEFLLEGEDFYLMEMNTRLQVEHAVTEAITGLDLVEWQIRVARGEPLPLAQEQIRFHGHAVEVRLCAEDENYVPHTGRILHFSQPRAAAFGVAALRFDHVLETGAKVTAHYDAMLGKLVAHCSTRSEAIDRLLGALAETEVLGLPTNRSFLMACLDDVRFRAGTALIPFLDEHGDEIRERLYQQEQSVHAEHAVAVAFAHGGGVLPCHFAVPLRLSHRDEVAEYAVRAIPGGVELLDDPSGRVKEQCLNDGSKRRVYKDISRRVRAVHVPRAGAPQRWHAQVGAVDWWFEDLSFQTKVSAAGAQVETELRAPLNGQVVRVAVQVGDTLQAGSTAVVIESMKMEHNVSPRANATVAEMLVEVGQHVGLGQVLLRFETQGTESGAE